MQFSLGRCRWRDGNKTHFLSACARLLCRSLEVGVCVSECTGHFRAVAVKAILHMNWHTAARMCVITKSNMDTDCEGRLLFRRMYRVRAHRPTRRKLQAMTRRRHANVSLRCYLPVCRRSISAKSVVFAFRAAFVLCLHEHSDVILFEESSIFTHLYDEQPAVLGDRAS